MAADPTPPVPGAGAIHPKGTPARGAFRGQPVGVLFPLLALACGLVVALCAPLPWARGAGLRFVPVIAGEPD